MPGTGLVVQRDSMRLCCGRGGFESAFGVVISIDNLEVARSKVTVKLTHDVGKAVIHKLACEWNSGFHDLFVPEVRTLQSFYQFIENTLNVRELLFDIAHQLDFGWLGLHRSKTDEQYQNGGPGK